MAKQKKAEQEEQSPDVVAVEAVRNALHEACKDLDPLYYREVLEVLQADIAGHLDALDEEGG